MIGRIDLRGGRPSGAALAAAIPRAESEERSVEDAARALIDEVRTGGVTALYDQSDRFDGGRPSALRVDPEAIVDAVAFLPPAVRAALEEAIARVRAASAAQIPATAITEFAPGQRVIQRWRPVGRVGLYVPGGKAVYPSTVVMNAVPAQVAGVSSIALASPPQAEYESCVHPLILGAAGLLGIDEVYAMGGAGAIGALAYGLPDADLDRVDVVTGPGNRYVAAAKRAVRGVVGVDSEAGPTEVLVIADASADPELVAADLVSQAEHDEDAAAVLVTDSPELADAVERALVPRAAGASASARVVRALAGSQSAIVLVDDLPTAAAFANEYAPEHLEIQTAEPWAVLDLITDAGVVFLGPDAPVSLGDYLAGSNHVLPTGGGARYSSALSASTFLRPQQVVDYDREGLRAVAPHIRALSDAEGLPAHGDAVDARLTGD